MLTALLWLSLAFADPDPLAPLVSELASLPDHAARQARIEAMIPSLDPANQARLRDADAVVKAMAAARVADRSEIRSFLYAGLSTDAAARKQALETATRGGSAPIVGNWPTYTGPAGPASVPTPATPVPATPPVPAVASTPAAAPKAPVNLIDGLPDSIAALPTNAGRLAKLQGMLGDPGLDADQLSRVSAGLVVMRSLDQQKRSDPSVVRWFLKDALSPDSGRRQLAIDAAKAGGDPPVLTHSGATSAATTVAPTASVAGPTPVSVTPPPATAAPTAPPLDMAKLRQYRAQYLRRAALTEVFGNRNSVTTLTTWAVYDGGGSPIRTLEFARITGDAATPTLIHSRIRTSLIGGVLLTAAGVVVIAAAPRPLPVLAGCLLITVGIYWPAGTVIRAEYPHLYYTPNAADKRIEAFNAKLRERLNLSEQDTLTVDTR